MNPPLPQRSRSESLFMTMPLVFAGFLITAVGILAFLVWKGGEATGARVKIEFEIPCENPDVTKIQNVMQKRISDIGLGHPQIEILSIEGKPVILLLATLPGLEGDFDKIPAVLSRKGDLQIIDKTGNILAEKGNLKETTLALDESGMPYVGLFLDAESLGKMSEYVSTNTQDYMDIFVDKERAARRPNTVKVQVEDDFEIRMISEDGDVRQRMQLAADRAIVLSHASYPCALHVKKVTEVFDVQP